MVLLTDNEYLPFTTTLIENAQQSIDISTFKAELTTKPRGRRLAAFFDVINKKARRGLPVRFLISKREEYGHIPLTNLFAVRELKANKVQVRHLRHSRICHAKIIIVDSRYAVIGSHNLSIKSCARNFEVSVYFNDTETVKHLSNVYTRTFEDAKKG